MEDNNNYTYTYQRGTKKDQSDNKKIIMLLIAAIALIIVLGVVIGKYAGARSAKKQAEKTSTSEPETSSVEVQTEEVTTSRYNEGEYVISADGYSLKFRKNYSLDSEVILEIKDGTRLNITEIYHDETATGPDSVEYWGKTSYYGYDGWVAMNYLTYLYSDTIVTPNEVSGETSAEEPSAQLSTEASSDTSTTAAAESTSSSGETQSEGQSSASESTTAAAGTKYTPGDYKVKTGGSSLSFRKSSSTSSEIIMSISDGTTVTVTKVVEVQGAASEEVRYWGQISYQGHTGYVSMYYLEKAA